MSKRSRGGKFTKKVSRNFNLNNELKSINQSTEPMNTQAIEKSQRINLTKYDAGISEKKARKLSYVIGGMFLLSSLFMLFDYLEEGTQLGKHILVGVLYLVSGGIFLFRAKTTFSETSKVAPHILMTVDGIKIKTSILGKSQFIRWTDIQKVEIQYKRIGFKLNNTKKTIYYPYKSRKNTSIQIKRALEDIASKEGIEMEISQKDKLS
jgi:hypothetical protein